MSRILLQLGGLEADNGHVRLAAFLEELQALSGALNRADEIATGGQRATFFQIVSLSYASPVMMELEPRTRSNRVPDVRAKTATIFREHLSAVETGTLGKIKLDYDLLGQVKAFIEPVGKKVRSAAVSVDNHRFEMMPAYVAQIDSALAPIEYCLGSMDGMLEQINIHAGANVFTLYPVVGPGSVRCHFGLANRDLALSAMGRRVAVTGKFGYRRDAPYPHEITEIERIDIFPPPEELTSLADLRGRAPDATGEKSSEEYIAELRRVWC